MFQVSICPVDEVLHINCHTFEQAKERAKEYYPTACFMEMDTEKSLTYIYEKFYSDYSMMNHVGNIWRL